MSHKKKTFQAKIATFGGDIWIPNGISCIFPPWPIRPILHGQHKKQTNGLDYRCFTRLLKPGDMLLCYADEFFGSNGNIKATVFKHLAIYTGPIKGVYDQTEQMFSKVKAVGADEFEKHGCSAKGYFDRTVTHATSDGVIVEDFYDFFHHYDKVAAIRPSEDPLIQRVIVESVLSNVGLDYNFDFTPEGPTSFYCTELGVYALENAGLPVPEKFSINVNWKAFLPWNLLSNKYKFPVTLADDFAAIYPMVCSTVSCDQSSFWAESRHSDKIRKAIQESPDARTMFY